MPRLLVHRVADFDKWKRVFDSHAEAQRKSGLQVERVMRNLDDPSKVVMLFDVTDLEAARRFVSSPAVPGAQQDSGVVDTPNVYFLS